ncbi:MAG: HNH endonuclease [Muribaculaceae bacterium]|nr:HNH endonuclease [Muribaculaceae bacterium]
MSFEAELTRKELQQTPEKLHESIKHTMLESDMVLPKKKETKLFDTEIRNTLAETRNRIESNRVAEGLSLRDLTDSEKQRLKNIGMSITNIDRCKIDERGVFHLICRNSNMEGMRHPATGVSFERKRISIHGVILEGVFPKFQSVVELQLPERLHRATQSEQFRHLNTQLREAIDRDPRLREKFTEQQIRMIESGRNPAGFTWHHNELCGQMQLVETAEHAATGHTGGDSIWCGC